MCRSSPPIATARHRLPLLATDCHCSPLIATRLPLDCHMMGRAEFPPSRPQVLWLLTFSAPDAAFDMLRPMFEKASASK